MRIIQGGDWANLDMFNAWPDTTAVSDNGRIRIPADEAAAMIERFNASERQRIVDKAYEQYKLQAEQAKIEADLLLPVRDSWPFRLSEDDRTFLRINKIDPA